MLITKREGESSTSLIYRFTKKVQQSGVLKEIRKRRFSARGANRTKRRYLALKNAQKRRDAEYRKKMGLS